jgi:indoleamine 2,3-dioxygenase
VLTALFRDYTFWASAYLLEPCDFQFRRNGTYGLGRQTLPRNIAVPLTKIAQRIGAKPFMEYAMSYALYNWQRKNPTGALNFDNLELIRSFEGSEHEKGFIIVHVEVLNII